MRSSDGSSDVCSSDLLAGGMVGDDEQAGAGRAGNHFMRLGNHRSDRTSGLLVRPSDVMKHWRLQGAAHGAGMAEKTAAGTARQIGRASVGKGRVSTGISRWWP